MNDRWEETLSRLMDGDSVDPGVVAEALESSDGRRLLVDFAAARAAVHRDAAAPSTRFYALMQSILTTTEPQRSPVRVIPLRIAAASVAAALLLGFWIDSRRHQRVDAPPSAARVLRFDAAEWTSAKGSVR